MAKIQIITLGICLWASFCSAQSPRENLGKYWDYRERFLAGFIDIGTAPGQSLPVAGKHPTADCEKYWTVDYNNCPKKQGQGIVYWGDGGIEMGHYIAVLALEIRNAKDAGQPYKETAYELHSAIKAFERLDYMAETYFGEEPELNGFFIRDDVPTDFFEKDDGEYRFYLNPSWGYGCIVSDGSCDTGNIVDGAIMSQDQVINVLFGFVFVSELIPEISYNGENLADLVALQAHRVASFLSDHKWKVITPTGDRTAQKWGGNAIGLSFAIAEAADRITKGKYRKSYHSGRSKRRGKMIFNTFNWAHNLQGEHNLWMAYAGAVAAKRWDIKRMCERTLREEREMYALAYSVINRQKMRADIIDREHIEKILDSAPPDGPCYKVPGCEGADGWKASCRWIHTNKKNGGGNEYLFNGLDYMLLYNLYHYTYKSVLPKYRKGRGN